MEAPESLAVKAFQDIAGLKPVSGRHSRVTASLRNHYGKETAYFLSLPAKKMRTGGDIFSILSSTTGKLILIHPQLYFIAMSDITHSVAAISFVHQEFNAVAVGG